MLQRQRNEKEWQAYYDAKTLIEAKIIKGDKTRFNVAKTEAKKVIDEKKVETEAWEQLAKANTKLG